MFEFTMAEANETTDRGILARLVMAVPSSWQTKITLCKTLSEAWAEFNLVITKGAVQEQVYGDFKKTKKVHTPDPVAIREFVSGIRLFIKRMTDLGKQAETETDSCLSDIRFKICEELNLSYASFIALKEIPPDVPSLLEFLEREATVREGCQKVSYQKGKFSKEQERNTQRAVNVVRGSVEQTGRENGELCALGCKVGYALFRCEKFQKMSVEERVDYVTLNRRCFLCPRKGHRACDCRSRIDCNKCHKRHSALLHRERPGPARQSPDTLDETGNLNPNADTFQPEVKVSNCRCLANGANEEDTDGTFVPVVAVEILDHRNRPMSALALLDSGSDTTLISENCVR